MRTTDRPDGDTLPDDVSDTLPFKLRMQRFFARRVTRPGPHRWAYRATGGLVGSRLPGVTPRVLLLTTTGRVTGTRHTTPVVFFGLDGAVVVVGTNGGSDRDPHWAANLRAHRRATIQQG